MIHVDVSTLYDISLDKTANRLQGRGVCSSLLKTSVLRTRVQAHQGETRSDLHSPRMLAGPRSVSISDAVEALSAACKEQLALGLAQVGGPRGESLK